MLVSKKSSLKGEFKSFLTILPVGGGFVLRIDFQFFGVGPMLEYLVYIYVKI